MSETAIKVKHQGITGSSCGPDGRWMLNRIYPHAVNLGMYLEVWLGDIVARAPSSVSAAAINHAGGPSLFITQQDDGPGLKERLAAVFGITHRSKPVSQNLQILRETLVAYSPLPGTAVQDEDHALLPRHASLQNRSSMADLLDRVIKSLLRPSSFGQGGNNGRYFVAHGDDPRRNVLSLGYQIAGPQAKSELLSVQGVACSFPNTTVNVIRSPPWELLLSRIGDDLMFALLRQHTVLHRLPNRCYMQLAGRPVPDLCRHLGLTTGTLLSARAAATPTVTSASKKNAGRTSNPPSNKTGGDCASSIPVGCSSSSASEQDPQATSAQDNASPPPLVDLHATQLKRGGGIPKGTARPGLRPVVILPRHRIFYSSTFVRKAGFPRGHPLNPCGHPSYSTGQHSPNTAPPSLVQDPSTSEKAGSQATALTTASSRLVIGVFCPTVDGTGQRNVGEGLQGSRAGLQRAGLGPMSTKKAGKSASEGRRRLPKRLHRVVPLFEEMLKRAHRCNFGRLLEAYCPLPVSVSRVKVQDRAKQGWGQGTRAGEMEDPILPSPSPSSTSTLLDCAGFEDSQSIVAWSQIDMRDGENEDGGTGNEGEGIEEDIDCSGSTLKDVFSQSSAVYLSQIGDACNNARKSGGNSSDGSCAARSLKRVREPAGGCTNSISEQTNEGLPADCTTALSERRDDATSDVTMVEKDNNKTGLNAAEQELRAGHATPSPPVSLDLDMAFIEMATEHRRVVDLLCQACHRIFPTELWGSKRNMVCLARAVERFIILRRHESMSVLEVTAGMHTSDFAWMSLSSDRKQPHGKHGMGRAVKHVDRTSSGNADKTVSQTQCVVGFPEKSSEEYVALEMLPRAYERKKGKGVGTKSDIPHKEDCTGASGKFNQTDGELGENSFFSHRGSNVSKGYARSKRKAGQRVGAKAKSKGRRGTNNRKGYKCSEGGCGRYPPSELAKRTQLLEALVLWTFKGVIIPLLRSLFYVTECETTSQEVFFFRKPIWAKFRTASIRHLTSRQYRKISPHEAFHGKNAGEEDDAAGRTPFQLQQPWISRTQTISLAAKRMNTSGGRGVGNSAVRSWEFPVSGVRLVPKANGVRAITNLSKRAWARKDCVQWIKGVPLLAPRKYSTLQRSSSNTSSLSAETGAVKDSRVGNGCLRIEAGGGKGSVVPAADRQAKHRRLDAGRMGGLSGSADVLLPSTNMQLSNAFHVLKHEYLKEPSLVGAGVFGLDDVFARMKPFVSKNLRPLYSPPARNNNTINNNDCNWEDQPNSHNLSDKLDDRKSGQISRGAVHVAQVEADAGAIFENSERNVVGNGQEKECPRYSSDQPRGDLLPSGGVKRWEQQRKERGGARRPNRLPVLYFASVDIKHCYDTVDQARLMDIIRPLVSSEDYVVQKYTKAHPFKAMGRVQVSHVKEAVAMEDMSQFRTRCEKLAAESIDTIFTDQVVYGVVSRANVLDMVDDHITHNVVRVPAAAGSGRGAYFRQAEGIPQGSVLSGLLCNYFFGYIEKRLLRDVLESPLLPNLPDTASMPHKVRSSANASDPHISLRGHNGGSRAGVKEQVPSSSCEPNVQNLHGAETTRNANPGYDAAVPPSSRSYCAHTHSQPGGSGCENRYVPADKEKSSSVDLSPFPHPGGDCTLLRQVDDFLLVSTSKAKAEAFVRVMHDRAKTGEWGFGVHEAKTMVNFDMTVEGGPREPVRQVRRIEGKMFPWCGLRFDTKTCEIMANYSRYSKSNVSESVTVESRRAGACLMGKMKRFVSPKCHALMLDEGELGINSRQAVMLNVYEMLLVCAAKTAASALRLPRGPVGNASLLRNGALETTAYAYSLIQSRSNRRKGGFGTSKGVRCVCKINRFEVTWLGLHAFREVFAVFSTKHRGFTRIKLDMHNALVEAEGGTDFEENERGSRRGGVERSTGRRFSETKARRGEAYGRLCRVVRCPDALGLLRTLTA